MKSLLVTIAQRILKEGQVRESDLQRLRTYANKHPMWRACATPDMIRTYEMIMSVAR